MRNIYKNPTFYYVLVPVVVALWPLLVWTLYLPKTERNWNLEKEQYNKSQELIAEILVFDADRLELAGSKDTAAEFDYAVAVEKIAALCRIPSSNYNLSSGIIITTAGQKSQSAKVGLKQVDLTKFARFLSTIQLHWANLQCVQVKLDKKKGLSDVWDVDLEFKYYY